MKSNKGQALIEFILILPIFLTIFLGIIDFGRILYEKNRLENVMSDVIDMINIGQSKEKIGLHISQYYSSKINLQINIEDNNKIVVLSTGIDTYTPGLNRIISKPYIIETTMVIFNE